MDEAFYYAKAVRQGRSVLFTGKSSNIYRKTWDYIRNRDNIQMGHRELAWDLAASGEVADPREIRCWVGPGCQQRPNAL